MKTNLWTAVILALAVGIGGYFWLQSAKSPTQTTTESSLASSTSDTPQPPTDDTSITSYDECIAAGNTTLPDAPDKCLTKSGHIFIQGVIE